MYNISRQLSALVRGACQHFAFPAHTGSFAERGNAQITRAVCFSAVRFQESVTIDHNTNNSEKKEFSFYPPMPGQESSLRWAGMKFEELPIAHIKATYNNTHVQVTDSKGQYMVRTSCGTEGFKNAKKGTPIAAQTAGISAAAKAQAKGVAFVRVLVKGLGPGRLVSPFTYLSTQNNRTYLSAPTNDRSRICGAVGAVHYIRLSAIKGLTMGGLEIVSITDNTPVPHNGCRPRKARRM